MHKLSKLDKTTLAHLPQTCLFSRLVKMHPRPRCRRLGSCKNIFLFGEVVNDYHWDKFNCFWLYTFNRDRVCVTRPIWPVLRSVSSFLHGNLKLASSFFRLYSRWINGFAMGEPIWDLRWLFMAGKFSFFFSYKSINRSRYNHRKECFLVIPFARNGFCIDLPFVCLFVFLVHKPLGKHWCGSILEWLGHAGSFQYS